MRLTWRTLFWAFLIALAILIAVDWAHGQTVPATRIRFSATTNQTPPTGFFNFYIDQANGLLKCRNDAGGDCFPAGGGGTFPQTKASIANEWLKSYDAGTGLFTSTQPAFSNLSGSATDAQIPNTITIDLATAAAALSGTPTLCSVGDAARGILANGNATGCFTPGGGSGITSLGGLSDAVQTFTSPDDTNVTLTISSAAANHAFTMGWTGTLAAARLNANVVQAVTNDTNVTGSIATQTLTLGWTGALAKARQHAATVYNDQANVYMAGSKQTVTESATTAGLNLNGVTADPSVLANGDFWRNTTSDSFKARVNGVTKIFAFTDSALTGNTSGTAAALTANGTNCSANQFNKGVDASGNAESCAALLDADVPNTITIDLATAATALAANPADCAANQFATTIAASGALSCAAITDADVPNNITISLAAAATALAANGTNCASTEAAIGVDASGNAEGCWTPGAGGGAPTTSTYLVQSADAGLSNELVVTPGEGMERRINETNSNGGPYTLDFDPNDPTYFWIREEFCGGLTTTGNVGDNGWNLITIGAAPTITYQALAVPNLCAARLSTTATTAQGGTLSPALVQTHGNLGGNTNWEVTWIFRLQATTTESFRVGLVAAMNAIEPTGGIWLRYDTNLADAAFKVETRSASTSTVGGTTYTVDTNFHKIRIRSTTAGTIVFTFDNNADQTISTNVPTVAMAPGVVLATRAASARTVDVDFFAFKMRGLAR